MLASLCRGPVKSVLPKLEFAHQIGLYFKIICHGLKKNCWAGDLLLGSFEVACHGQKSQFAAVVLWSFGNTDMNHDQFWSIHFWQHGFSVRGAITQTSSEFISLSLIANFFTTKLHFVLKTKGEDFYHPSKVWFSIFWPQSHISVKKNEILSTVWFTRKIHAFD